MSIIGNCRTFYRLMLTSVKRICRLKLSWKYPISSDIKVLEMVHNAKWSFNKEPVQMNSIHNVTIIIQYRCPVQMNKVLQPLLHFSDSNLTNCGLNHLSISTIILEQSPNFQRLLQLPPGGTWYSMIILPVTPVNLREHEPLLCIKVNSLKVSSNDLFLLARNIRLYLQINTVIAIFILPMRHVAQKWILHF